MDTGESWQKKRPAIYETPALLTTPNQVQCNMSTSNYNGVGRVVTRKTYFQNLQCLGYVVNSGNFLSFVLVCMGDGRWCRRIMDT